MVMLLKVSIISYSCSQEALFKRVYGVRVCQKVLKKSIKHKIATDMSGLIDS